MNWKHLAVLAIATALGGTVACEGPGGEDADFDTGPAADTPATSTTQVPAETDPVDAMELVAGADVELAPIDRSGITGTARGEGNGDGATLTLEMEGLEPGSDYPAHIHAGRCAGGGPVVYALDDVPAAEDGSGDSTADLAEPDLEDGEPLFVQVHAPDGTPVACGDLGGGEPDARPADTSNAGASSS